MDFAGEKNLGKQVKHELRDSKTMGQKKKQKERGLINGLFVYDKVPLNPTRWHW